MSGPIRFNVYVTVKEGRLDEFKQIARDWSSYQKKERPDILSYEWFLSSDEKHCQVVELYESSEAMLKTMGATSESESDENPDYPYQITKLEVLGNVSGELREKLAAGDSPVDYWTYLDGFIR